jgi:TM2 domain-containing membrane protein YozV
MDLYQIPYMAFPGITPEEINFLQQVTADLSENQKKYFYMVYSGKRKNPQDILLFTLIAFVGVPGVQRFVLGQIGMGLLYVFTGGCCLIGTIVDLVNHKELTYEYNKKMVLESYRIASTGN